VGSTAFLPWYVRHFLKKYKRLRDLHKIESRNPTATIEEDVLVLNRKKLFLGLHVYVSKGTLLHCGGGAWCDHGGRISIGDHVYIGPYGILLGAGEIEIQKGCQLGPQVQIISHGLARDVRDDVGLLEGDVPPHKFGKVTLEEGVVVGAGSIILEGVTVGRGSGVSAGSIVQKDVPPDSLVVSGRRGKIVDKKSSLFLPT